MSKSFSIRDITAEKGSKTTGLLTIQDDAAGIVKLLVGIVNGSGEGPVLCVTGGNFGTQYAGIDAIIRVFNELDPKKLNGTIITVPVMNLPAFQKGLDDSPIDGLGLNRVFPGDPEGTITRRIAHVVLNEVIKRSQYHLDLRGGDSGETILEFGSVSEVGIEEFDDETSEIAKILGVKYWLRGPYGRRAIITQACLAGVHSLALLGYKGLGTYDEEDVQTCRRGIYNLLKYLKMMDGKLEIPTKPIRIAFEMPTTMAEHGGLLYLDVKVGDIVTKGQKVGEIRGLKGETLQTVTVLGDGVVHAIYPKHIKQPGERILNVRAILE